jgi:hypothetical protein
MCFRSCVVFYEVKIQSFVDEFHPLLVSCLCYAAHRFEHVLLVATATSDFLVFVAGGLESIRFVLR